jgi:hypothetical protein
VTRRTRRNTPIKPPVKGRLVEQPAPRPTPARRDPSTVRGLRSGFFCPDCRSELLTQDLTILLCSGCGLGYWQRGGEIVREGETDAVVTPDTHVPRAQARMRPAKPKRNS